MVARRVVVVVAVADVIVVFLFVLLLLLLLLLLLKELRHECYLRQSSFGIHALCAYVYAPTLRVWSWHVFCVWRRPHGALVGTA